MFKPVLVRPARKTRKWQEMRIAKARSRPRNSKGRTVALGAVLALMALVVVTLSFLIGDNVPLAPSTDSRSQEANDTPAQFPALQQSASNDTAVEMTAVETDEPNAVESLEHPIQTNRSGDAVAVGPMDETVAVGVSASAPETTQMVRGILVDAEGNPVAGYVTFDSVFGAFDVEPASTFAIPAPDRVPPQGVIGYARDVSGELERRFLWKKGAQDGEMTIVLEPCASLVGRLVDSQRRPVSSARLDLQTQMLDGTWRPGDEFPKTPAVDEEGYFVFDRIAIGLRLKITAHRGTLSGRSREIQLAAGRMIDAGEIVMVGLRPGVGIVQGRITDETGRPLADRAVNARVGRSGQWLRTDEDGYYVMTDLPTDRAITVTIEVEPYGSWSRTTAPDDFACDFRLCPQGWDALGQEALPLFAGRWFNHAPMTLKEARGRVVLLTFRDFAGDRDPGLSRLQNLHTQYGQRGLLIIAVYTHLPQGSPLAEEVVAGYLAASFGDAPIAGFLDSDPALVADLMAVERPAGATGGATHWLYQVHSRPAFYLIDKAGTVRYCTNEIGQVNRWVDLLLDE